MKTRLFNVAVDDLAEHSNKIKIDQFYRMYSLTVFLFFFIK